MKLIGKYLTHSSHSLNRDSQKYPPPKRFHLLNKLDFLLTKIQNDALNPNYFSRIFAIFILAFEDHLKKQKLISLKNTKSQFGPFLFFYFSQIVLNNPEKIAKIQEN